MKKQIAESLLFILILACMGVPFIKWILNPELTQMQVFLDTWLWLVYALIVYVFGTSTIKGIWE